MATQRLTWDDAGKRLYETGVKQEFFTRRTITAHTQKA